MFIVRILLIDTELKDMLQSTDYESRDASNDLLHQLCLVDTNEYIDTIKGEIGGKLDYLKSCDDYCSQEACDSVTFIENFSWSLTPGRPKERMCSRLVDFLLEQGLGQLIVKMMDSYTSETDKMAYKFRRKLHYLVLGLVSNSEKLRVKVDLVQQGIIPALVKDLDSYDPDTEDPRQRIRILDIIRTLIALVNTPNVTSIYRSGNAVPILMKVVQANDPMTQVLSLSVLCEIVNEEESQLLATTGNCITAMVDAIQEAAKSDDRWYSVAVEVDGSDPEEYAAVLKSLLYYTSKLASNDANKEAIVQHGGVPVLTAILRPDYTDDEKQAAIGVLQKLASLESNCDVIATHVTATDKNALQGNYKYVTKTVRSYN